MSEVGLCVDSDRHALHLKLAWDVHADAGAFHCITCLQLYFAVFKAQEPFSAGSV